MKKIVLISFLLIANYAFSQVSRVRNLEEAKAMASKEGKTIMIIFSGSDWCIPCMRLEKEILSQPEFESFEAKKIVLLKADFPLRNKNKKLISKKRQASNAKLFEKYNHLGTFPLVVLLNSGGKIIAETSYRNMSSGDYASYIDNLISSK